MTQLKLLEEQLLQLPPEKQAEVLDFASFLAQQISAQRERPACGSLKNHAAFGSWTERGINSLTYESACRAEWDAHG